MGAATRAADGQKLLTGSGEAWPRSHRDHDRLRRPCQEFWTLFALALTVTWSAPASARWEVEIINGETREARRLFPTESEYAVPIKLGGWQCLVTPIERVRGGQARTIMCFRTAGAAVQQHAGVSPTGDVTYSRFYLTEFPKGGDPKRPARGWEVMLTYRK